MGLAPRHRNRGHRRHHQGTHWPTLYSFLKLTEFLCVCVCVWLCVCVCGCVCVCVCVCVVVLLVCGCVCDGTRGHTDCGFMARHVWGLDGNHIPFFFLITHTT